MVETVKTLSENLILVVDEENGEEVPVNFSSMATVINRLKAAVSQVSCVFY